MSTCLYGGAAKLAVAAAVDASSSRALIGAGGGAASGPRRRQLRGGGRSDGAISVLLLRGQVAPGGRQLTHRVAKVRLQVRQHHRRT